MDSLELDDPLEDISGVYVLSLESLLELLDLLRGSLLKLIPLPSEFSIRLPEFICLWMSAKLYSMAAFN